MSTIPTELYQQIHAAVPIACVDIVLVHNDQILLGQRTNQPAQGQLWFPGGRVHKGETRSAAAIRKALEETGLAVTLIAELGTEETIFPDGPFGTPTHTINTVFLATPDTPSPMSEDAQHDTLTWFATIPADVHPYVYKYCQLALNK